jgi:hypothetical protein
MVQISKPGDCVSVDHLESPTPCFIRQIKSILTKKRYTAATIFLDHHRQLGFIYLQQSTNAEETLHAKKAFEAYSRSHGVHIRHYYANNGRFAENAWIAHIEQSPFLEWSGGKTHSRPPRESSNYDAQIQ